MNRRQLRYASKPWFAVGWLDEEERETCSECGDTIPRGDAIHVSAYADVYAGYYHKGTCYLNLINRMDS
jgi:hypothetical protein